MSENPEDRGRYLATADTIRLADSVPMADFEALRVFVRWQQSEIERLHTAIREAYIEGHSDSGQGWSKNYRYSTGYAEHDWLESHARKAADAAERGEG